MELVIISEDRHLKPKLKLKVFRSFFDAADRRIFKNFETEV